ncbi:hypothetical protein [Streptococcus oralis]|nr:hypothetical protein [Streptococcus oralis]
MLLYFQSPKNQSLSAAVDWLLLLTLSAMTKLVNLAGVRQRTL